MAVENLDLLLECGFNKAVARIKLNDRVNIVQTVTLHKVVLSTLGELTQFKEGLSALGVLDALKDHPDLLQSYYCCNYDDKLTPDTVRKLFTDIKFSEKGTNEREREEKAFMHFIDYLDDCEKVTGHTDGIECESDDDTGGKADSECTVSVGTVLAFFTGADTIPPLGYTSAVLNFNQFNEYPTASTCAVELTLPTKHAQYEQFKKQLDVAFTMHGGFGLV
jgi:hypothetical protein